MSNKWLDELMEKISDCWEWYAPALKIGFQYIEPERADEGWEIWAHPAVQEIVGGKEDGETVWSGFNFDVLEFLSDFEPEAVVINTRRPADPAELIFEGRFRGRGVFLHISLEPPEDAKATEIVDFSGGGGPVIREKE